MEQQLGRHDCLTFTSFLARTALRLPDKIALAYDGRYYSYRELVQAIAGVSDHLRATHGVDKGDRVALLLDNSDLYVIWYLAILAMGAVAVPLNIKLTTRELSFMLADSGSSLLLSEKKFSATLDALVQDLGDRCEVALVTPTTQPTPRPSDLQNTDVPLTADAAIYYTSGTTGQPKGVVHTHRSLIAGALQGLLGWEYWQEWVVNLATTPLFHIANHTVFLPSLCAGGTLVIDTFKVDKIFGLIERHKTTYFFAVPSMLLMMLQSPRRTEHDLSCVTKVVFGAAPMPAHRLKAVQEMFPNAALVHGMGQTECCGTTLTLPSEHAFAKAGSVGIAIPGTEIRIVDSADQELPPGEVGELVTRGPNVMRHYLGRPDATAEALRGGWLHTGDLGYRDDEGYVFLVDRKKDMIIRGGENIYSTEIEQVLTMHPDIAAAAVIGINNEVFGEEVQACLVAHEGARQLSLQEIQAHCEQHLAKFKLPVAVHYIGVMPQTATGKIQKGELRTMLMSEQRGAQQHD
ncbi:MAG: AMP-binding protein [Comamonadaceae bacterium]|nr:AMP-binding protein [Comamonadaceae bacterium]